MKRPLTPKTSLPDFWTKRHIGLIKYDRYWKAYSLILDVEVPDDQDPDGRGSWVTELDAFGLTNHTHKHTLRRHCTPVAMGDLFWTVEEFARIVKYEQSKQTDARDTP